LANELINIIVRNLEAVRPYLQKNNITAFRILHNTQRAYPLAVDIYQDNAVIHVFDTVSTGALSELEIALKECLNIRDFFYKNRTKAELALPESQPKKIVVEEYGRKFLVNLSDYLDTGLFLDHRETRKWLAGLRGAKTILNTFAYTGSFSVYAAASGAGKTYSVDLSKVYCDWTRENLNLNNLSIEQNWVVKMDTLEYFAYAKKKNLLFDIIIIDPPTFSKNKNKSFSVQKDHPLLINTALDLLTPGGFVLFSNNFKEFHMSYRELLPCNVKEKMDSIPPDYAGTHPHKCYLIYPKK
jgi:23S rRNA (cytosine1962-C5)-methyltransferase